MKKTIQQSHNFHPSILRAYDIRGILGETLSEDDAYYLGKAFGSFISDNKGRKKVCVGFDGRLSSPALEDKIVRGLLETGAEVIRVGLGPTPMLYFSVQHFQADGGIMITGSHNPPSHNGFKMMFGKLPLHGADILKLGELAARGEFVRGSGAVTFEDVKEDYIQHLVDTCKLGNSSLRVAWDAGNGAAGEIMDALTLRIAGEHILLNEKIDGTFPSHHPDPSVLANMQQLIDVVKAKKCDLGIAFDGDGDRIGVIDNAGNMIFGDQLMVLFSEEVLAKNKGGTVIADVKASQVLFDEIAKFGGKPIMWKTGHSLIKTKMFEENAVLAGEMSGHIFFKDNFGFDDGIFAAVKLLNIVAKLKGSLAEKIDTLPKTFNTPEIRVHVDEKIKFSIVEEIKQEVKASGAVVNDVDGVRALIGDGWWLLRASNTEAALVLRCEAQSESGLQALKDSIFGLLRKRGVKAGLDTQH
jgi:phosphomannomutase